LAGVFVDGDEGDAGGRRVLALSGKHVFGVNLDSHFHRGMKDAVDLRIHRYDLPEAYGGAEIDVIHRRGNGVTVRMALSGHRCGDIHQMHNMAAEKLAESVGLRGQDDFRHFRAGGAHWLALEFNVASLLLRVFPSAS
jgi:hypothetical protein